MLLGAAHEAVGATVGPPCDGRSSLGQLRGLRAARRRRRGQRTDGTVCGQRTTVGAGADKAPWYAANENTSLYPRECEPVQRRSSPSDDSRVPRIPPPAGMPGLRRLGAGILADFVICAAHCIETLPTQAPAVAGQRFPG